MRVCIDATALLLRSAGVKNYIHHWARSIEAEAPDVKIQRFPIFGNVGDLDHEKSMVNRWQTLAGIATLQSINYLSPRLIDWAVPHADVFHASSLVHASPRRSKLSGTIFDMTVKLFPQFHTKGNIDAETGYYERVLQKADGLIAISESAKNDAVRLLGLDPDKVTVAYPGIDPRYFEAKPTASERPYLLFLGTIEPRKNVDLLLDAWEQLLPQFRGEVDLIIAGPIGWAAGTTVDRLRSGIPGVQVAGYVPEAELPGLVAGATAFVYPSLYEGFGFPLAQAMAAGVPCVTSNVSSLPEIAGDAALLVEPQSVEQLSIAIERLVRSETLRDDLKRKGRERAKQFTWKNSAERSAEFFRRLI